MSDLPSIHTDVLQIQPNKSLDNSDQCSCNSFRYLTNLDKFSYNSDKVPDKSDEVPNESDKVPDESDKVPNDSEIIDLVLEAEQRSHFLALQ